jgi:hypothetical protein
MPHTLTFEAETIFESLCKGEADICQIFTLDETRVFLGEPELKRQSNKWHHQGSLYPQKFQQKQGQL